MTTRFILAVPLVALGLVSCSSAPQSHVAALPAGAGARCRVAASQTRPLIIEWPASDRMDLETMLRQSGGVVVRYSGCELELLPNCKAPGKYNYVAGTRQDERVTIRDEDELFAKLPIGAASLEATVSQGNELNVNMSVVGKYVSSQTKVQVRELTGPECKNATHMIVGLTTGSFEMGASAMRSTSVGVGLAGGGTSARTRVLRQGGATKDCDKATPGDAAPPEGCGALLRLELAQLDCPIAQEYVEGRGCVPVGQVAGTAAETSEDAGLARLMVETSHSMLNALQGNESDQRFQVKFSGDRSEYLAKAVGSGAGPKPKLQYVVGSVRAWSLKADPKKAVVVRALFHAWPSGKVRWGGLEIRDEDASDKYGVMGTFDQAEPGWRAAHEHVLRSFKDTVCRITPVVSGQELSSLSLSGSERKRLVSLIDDYKFDAERCSSAKSGKGPWQMYESRIYAVFGEGEKSFVMFGIIEPGKDKVTLTDAKVSFIGD